MVCGVCVPELSLLCDLRMLPSISGAAFLPALITYLGLLVGNLDNLVPS